MQHQITLPRFKYHCTKPSDSLFGCIEADGKVLCRVTNLDEFYATFGYSAEVRQQGILPDEFIWGEYIKGDNAKKFSTCMQVHIVEYLLAHSPTFVEQYGAQSRELLAAHVQEKLTNTEACAACRMKPFCEK